jgi:hypothetical protein
VLSMWREWIRSRNWRSNNDQSVEEDEGSRRNRPLHIPESAFAGIVDRRTRLKSRVPGL